MRVVPVVQRHVTDRTVVRVVELARLAEQWDPALHFAVAIESSDELARLASIAAGGVRNVMALTTQASTFSMSMLPALLVSSNLVESDDVLALTPGLKTLRVLYRPSDIHHTVFLTNRCNSNCLMCSQPPTRHDDSWLVDEALSVATHMRVSPNTVGFTGGEPLLLGNQLRVVLDAFLTAHPHARLDVLTNGRLLSDSLLASSLLTNLGRRVTWMVPLYGHADFLHDFIVQTHGAFDQTIDGLLALQAHQQPIQLRTVLVEPVLSVLPALCEFVGRNLPFVEEVALMGCEPIGFALANRDHCQVDLAHWRPQLVAAVDILRRAGLRVILMNTPLCSLPHGLWQYANQSISDWKRVYAAECELCSMKGRCCGLFASTETGWRPTTIRPIAEGEAHEAI